MPDKVYESNIKFGSGEIAKSTTDKLELRIKYLEWHVDKIEEALISTSTVGILAFKTRREDV